MHFSPGLPFLLLKESSARRDAVTTEHHLEWGRGGATVLMMAWSSASHPRPHPSTSAWALSQCPIGTKVPSPNWGRVSGPLGGQLVKAKATYGQLTPQQGAPWGRWAFPVCLPHRRMWYPGPVQPLAVRSSLFTGWLGRWCLHTKAPLWGRATRASIPVHSCGPLESQVYSFSPQLSYNQIK